jgi:glycosyltransferase involved in cell wall biosynthesis
MKRNLAVGILNNEIWRSGSNAGGLSTPVTARERENQTENECGTEHALIIMPFSMSANTSAVFHKGKPRVSIIVPARNEEASLGRCLGSLVSQTGIDFELIVVNDNSTDRTREIAASYPGVVVLDADPLPPGWTGKSHALHCGVQAAQGEWLLFTDADTIHRPGSLQRALSEAEEYDSDFLSYSPKQEVHGLWERALMPVIFAELWRQYPPRLVRDPNSKLAAANGQYILIRRTTYAAIGGHEAVRESLLEDVELARRAKAAGAQIRFRYGRDAVRTRMYRTFPQMWEGWTKNLALLFPHPLALAVLRSTEFTLSFGGLCLFFLGSYFRSPRVALSGAVISFPLTYAFFQRVRKSHFGWINTVISPAGLPLFVVLLLRSRRHHLENRVSWKGRDYAPQSRSDASEAEETVTSR